MSHIFGVYTSRGCINISVKKPRNVKTKGNIHRCSAGKCGGGEGGDIGQVETVPPHVNRSEMSQHQTWLAMIEYKMTDGRK